MTENDFERAVRRSAETGQLVILPDNIDKLTCGEIMAKVASAYVDNGQAIKAIIILNERKRLGV